MSRNYMSHNHTYMSHNYISHNHTGTGLAGPNQLDGGAAERGWAPAADGGSAPPDSAAEKRSAAAADQGAERDPPGSDLSSQAITI